MMDGRDENDIIKERAAADVVIFLEKWKKRNRRKKIIRLCIGISVFLLGAGLMGGGYYYIDSSIPSVINLRAGYNETFHLGIPAKAEIISVSEGGESNIPQGAVDIDLSKAFTLSGDVADNYRLQVKLFGFLNFKNVDVQVIEDCELIPVGQPVGIYVETAGVMVIGTGEFKGNNGANCAPAKYILKSGDYIRKVNGQTVEDKEDFTELVKKSGGNTMEITVWREGEETTVAVTPAMNTTGEYKLGLWVRDNAQGVGTLTYIDNQGNFGALGHGIADIDTSVLMNMENGTLYETEIIKIKRGEAGNPGEMTGMIVYSNERILGSITGNSEQGIFGVCNGKAISKYTCDPLPIGLKQEIVIGPAQILCTVDGTTQYYDVEITKVRQDNVDMNRGIELTVTDPDLIAATGGIIQGMSGSPIIQDGKIIGAVTHVLVNDPTRGYGIFIENMLEH